MNVQFAERDIFSIDSAKIPSSSEVGGCMRKVKRVAIAQSFIVLRILAALGTVVSLGTIFAHLFVIRERRSEPRNLKSYYFSALSSLPSNSFHSSSSRHFRKRC